MLNWTWVVRCRLCLCHLWHPLGVVLTLPFGVLVLDPGPVLSETWVGSLWEVELRAEPGRRGA